MNRQAGYGWPGDTRPGDDDQGSGVGDRQPGDQPGGLVGGLPGDDQPGDRQGQPTHRILKPPTSLAIGSLDRQAGDEAEAGDPGTWLSEALDGLRFVNNSPGSLRDQIDYAIDGAYSNRVDGWWRNANIIFARLIAVPGLTVVYLIGWAFFTRLSRALTCTPVLLFVLMLLNAMPITAWLIPDWADFTTWRFPWSS